MNAQNQFALETALAVFPSMVIHPEIEVLQDNTVLFSINKPKNDTDYICLSIKANASTDYIVWNKTSDPQNDREIDFDSLEVDVYTPATVTEVEECFAIEGMPVGLTEKQADALNGLLKEHFEYFTTKELTDWAA